MSGYLQRMAAMALRPKGSVHPFVEPTFGAVRQRGSETASRPVSETMPGEAAPRAQAASAGNSLGYPAHHDRTATDGTSPLQQQTARHDMYQPLMAEAGGEPVGSSPMLELVERGDPAVRFSPVRGTAEKDEASGRGRRGGGEAEKMAWTFEPLIRDMVREASGAESFAHRTRNGETVPNETPGFTRSAQDIQRGKGEAFGVGGLRSAAEIATSRRLAQEQASTQAGQQSDEIQIHIGRIEVTAVPPAAPRAIPVPARKTQTLDEYLRQSNGRAG